MLYREMPKTKDSISILGFGCMRLPGSQTNIKEKEAIELIRYAIDRGVNYVDTAWPYHGGKSEIVLGKALKEGYRKKVKIADKLPQWLCKKREDMDYYLDEQLKRLDVGVIDYYLIHSLDRQMWDKAVDRGIFDFMEKAKESGKIKNIGFSFHGARDDFMKIVDAYEWDFCQIQFNILDEHNQAGVEGLDYANSKGLGVIIMEPLRGGSLAGKLPDDVEQIFKNTDSGKSNAEWSLRWIWNHPGVITVLSGMNTMNQVKENIAIASDAEVSSLENKELQTVSDAAEKFRSIMKVPCTGCHYCMPCPHGVNIPHAFSFYNNKYLFRKGLINRIQYLLQLGGVQGGKKSLASQCISCGLCIKHCPQKIKIPAELRKVKKTFEGKLTTKPLLFLIKKMLSAGSKN